MKFSGMDPLLLFFFFKIALTIQDTLYFHMNLKAFFLPLKMGRDYLGSVNQFGEYCYYSFLNCSVSTRTDSTMRWFHLGFHSGRWLYRSNRIDLQNFKSTLGFGEISKNFFGNFFNCGTGIHNSFCLFSRCVGGEGASLQVDGAWGRVSQTKLLLPVMIL